MQILQTIHVNRRARMEKSDGWEVWLVEGKRFVAGFGEDVRDARRSIGGGGGGERDIYGMKIPYRNQKRSEIDRKFCLHGSH